MGALSTLVKGFPGKPLHPPLTDASIGAYTVGVAMLVLGSAGVEEEEMAHGALLAISGGLLLAAPTAITGLLDWLDLPSGTSRARVATAHLIAMVTATVLFALAWVTQLDGYEDGTVETPALILGVAAELVLTAGGYLGGTIVFVYGVRVLGRREAPARDALIPGREAVNQSAAPSETETTSERSTT
jgi:uncharacterized membrane protein